MKDKDWSVRAARLFCFCIYGAIIYALLRYALPVCLPLVVAFAVGAAVFCMAEKCSEWTHLPHALCAVFIICALAAAVGMLGAYVLRYLLTQISQILTAISQGGAQTVLDRAGETPVFKLVSSFIYHGDADAEELVGKAMTAVLSFTSDFIGGALGNALKSTPAAFITTMVAVIACFYIAIDMRRICASALAFMPLCARGALLRAREQVFPVLKGFAAAYMKIYALTFAEVFLGLSLLCPRFALLGALAVATVDILPVLGAGIVLIPWGVAALLMEDYFLGVGILVLYVIISIVRQIVEPRLLGSAVGLSPFVSLLAMFIGYRTLGVVGMLVLPAFLAVLKRLREGKK